MIEPCSRQPSCRLRTDPLGVDEGDGGLGDVLVGRGRIKLDELICPTVNLIEALEPVQHMFDSIFLVTHLVGMSGMMMGTSVRGVSVAGVLSLAIHVERSASKSPVLNLTGVTLAGTVRYPALIGRYLSLKIEMSSQPPQLDSCQYMAFGGHQRVQVYRTLGECHG